IEGHTDSDGTYLYNLDLSQKRAYAVMRYLLTLDFTEKNSLKPLLLASGRADQDTIKDKKAQEDKELSRRIEIKFTLKNDDALHEIERILDYE
ncbi:MAG: OmpA family protein, partial [Sulfurimonas sp.]|nr:OmpA family protein [Sulfurimonas sp.]